MISPPTFVRQLSQICTTENNHQWQCYLCFELEILNKSDWNWKNYRASNPQLEILIITLGNYWRLMTALVRLGIEIKLIVMEDLPFNWIFCLNKQGSCPQDENSPVHSNCIELTTWMTVEQSTQLWSIIQFDILNKLDSESDHFIDWFT